MTRFITQIVAALTVVLWAVPVSAQTDTTFTYQGRLLDGGNPASGPHDIDVSLWDAESGGSQVGATQSFAAVPVEVGLFTLELDFGANVFDNSNRWLELTVNTVLLSPRQLITRVPYAIQTRGIHTNDIGFVGIGRSNRHTSFEVFGIHRPGTGFGGMYSSTDGGGKPFYGYDTNGERAYHYLDGTTGDWHLFVDGTRLTVTDEGNVGIGITAPDYPLHIASAELVSMLVHNTRSTGSLGVWGAIDSPGGKAVYGVATHTSGTNTGVWGVSASTNGRGVHGFATALSGTNYGVLGESLNSNGYDFYARGAGINYGASSSRRWKSNVEPIGDPLYKLAQLHGVYFDWDDEHGGQHDVGMIAEEVGEILPEIVGYEENGIDAHGMDYSKMTPLLVEAVNALRSEKNRDITTLREAHAAEINELRRQLSDLQQIVEWLASNQEKENRQ